MWHSSVYKLRRECILVFWEVLSCCGALPQRVLECSWSETPVDSMPKLCQSALQFWTICNLSISAISVLPVQPCHYLFAISLFPVWQPSIVCPLFHQLYNLMSFIFQIRLLRMSMSQCMSNCPIAHVHFKSSNCPNVLLSDCPIVQVKALLVTHCALSSLLLSFFAVAAAVALIFRGQVENSLFPLFLFELTMLFVLQLELYQVWCFSCRLHCSWFWFAVEVEEGSLKAQLVREIRRFFLQLTKTHSYSLGKGQKWTYILKRS